MGTVRVFRRHLANGFIVQFHSEFKGSVFVQHLVILRILDSLADYEFVWLRGVRELHLGQVFCNGAGRAVAGGLEALHGRLCHGVRSAIRQAYQFLGLAVAECKRRCAVRKSYGVLTLAASVAETGITQCHGKCKVCLFVARDVACHRLCNFQAACFAGIREPNGVIVTGEQVDVLHRGRGSRAVDTRDEEWIIALWVLLDGILDTSWQIFHSDCLIVLQFDTRDAVIELYTCVIRCAVPG